MRWRIPVILLFVIIITAVASCSETKEPGQSSQDPVQQAAPFEELALFLNDEQVALYQKAGKVYRLFRGIPDLIDLPSYFQDGICNLEEQGYSSTTELVSHCINGMVRYVSCAGEIDSFSDFAELCGSVFTEGYWEELNTATGWGAPVFIEIDNCLFYADCSKGTTPGYDPEQYPDTYELSFRDEKEIRFSVIGHYKIYSNGDGEIDHFSIQTYSFPVKMVLEQEGWRFSLFSDPGLDLQAFS
ncbi:MAG: hypothetical protein II719_07015 [Clostridia bacterium]|nr:hypothetical protein [Clostridia bacterium]